jgi:hypothetical protein
MARTLRALQEGGARWRERMRLAKAAGLIERFPQGRKKGDSGVWSKDGRIAKAQREVERMRSVSKGSFVATTVPDTEVIPAELARAQRLGGLACQALDVIQMVFDLPLPDPTHPSFMKMVSAKKDAALSILSLQLKQPPPPDDGDEIVAELLRRVRGENAKTAEAPKPIAGPRLPSGRES